MNVGSCSARHGIGIHIHGVNRVSDGHHRVVGEKLLHIGHVALGAVGDEHLVRLNAQPLVVVVQNGLNQKIIAVVRAVAPKGLGPAHFPGGLFHGLHHGGSQRTGHVADAQPDQLRVGMLLSVFLHPAGDLRKEIAAGQLFIMGIHLQHDLVPPCCSSVLGFSPAATGRHKRTWRGRSYRRGRPARSTPDSACRRAGRSPHGVPSAR